jgi:hypothetical protein
VSESPAERRLHAQVAAHVQWANEPNRTARTAAARDGMWARFERQVDPDGVLPPDERARRAQSAYRAHMANMARLSAKARRERAERGQ